MRLNFIYHLFHITDQVKIIFYKMSENWIELSYKNNLDGDLCPNSKQWIKKLTVFQSPKGIIVVGIAKFSRKSGKRTKDFVFLTMEEYTFLVEMLHFIGPYSHKDQYFYQRFNNSRFVTMITNSKENGSVKVYQNTKRARRFVYLTSSEVIKILRSYMDLAQFVELPKSLVINDNTDIVIQDN